MDSFIEAVYYRSPTFLQNILVSIYGFTLMRERYSKNSKYYLKKLLQTEAYRSEDIIRLQEKRFVSLARHAISTVPYYRVWADENKVKAADISCISDLKSFPLLRKQTLRDQTDQFISDKYVKRKLVALQTSGTTGSPMKVYCDADTRTHHYAFFSRLRHWFGLRPRSRRATMFGRIIMLPEQQTLPFWRYDIANNNLLMSSYHLAEENLKYYYDKLVEYNPEEVIGYPSSVFQLAKFIVKNSLPPLKPKVMFTTAETLLMYQREVIESAFDAPVVDQYGCTEMAFFASQCDQGTMHFHPEHGIIETVDGKGATVKGSEGSLVVTGLLNFVMPLIRYEVGDRVTLSDSTTRCPCGRNFPIISQIEGRVDDVVFTRNGTPVGRLDPIFKGGSGVDEAQIIQQETGNIRILVIPTKDFDREKEEWLRQQIQKRVGTDLDVSIVLVKHIDKEPNGKFKAVISRYTPQ